MTRPGCRSAGHLRPSGRGRRWITRESPLARRPLVECSTVMEIPMYDQSKLSELIRFARVDAGRPSSMFTQATATGPVSSPTSWDPKDGSIASCRPKSPTSRTIRSAACGRLRRSRAGRTLKPSRRTSWRCRRPRNQRMFCGCTCSTTISTPRSSRPGARRRPGSIGPSTSG